MLRWALLAVLVVGLTGTATYLVQSGSVGGSSDGVDFASGAVQRGPTGRAVIIEGGDLTYDFGTMTQYTEGTHSWTLKNEGEGDLELIMGETSCSCTIADMVEGKTAQIKPGKTTKITLKWNTKDASGKFRQRAEVLTPSDEARQKLEFVVTGMISPAIVTIPPGKVLPFMDISNQEAHKARFALFSPDRPETTITELTTSRPDWIKVTYEPLNKTELEALETGRGYRVEVDLKEGLPLGQLHDELVIKTDHPKQPVLRMEITGRVIGPITAMPERVRITRMARDLPVKDTLTLWVRGQDVTRFQVADSPKNLKVDIAAADEKAKGGEKEARARRYRLTVTVPAGTPPGVIDGQIVLKTDHPNASELKIPINVTVEAASD